MEFVPLAEIREGHIYLVCGPYDFRGKIDGFLAKISEMMAENMAAGDLFVFCNYSRHQISALQWQGDGFAIMFKRTEEERYPWPVSAQVKVIEIHREDLQKLLEFPQFIRRLSGLTTPKNFM
jgi:transposase